MHKAFLAEQDGGRPVKDTFYFGVQPAPGDDLARVVETVGGMPPGILPTARDEQTSLAGLAQPPPLPHEPVVVSTAKGRRRLFSRR